MRRHSKRECSFLFSKTIKQIKIKRKNYAGPFVEAWPNWKAFEFKPLKRGGATVEATFEGTGVGKTFDSAVEETFDVAFGGVLFEIAAEGAPKVVILKRPVEEALKVEAFEGASKDFKEAIKGFEGAVRGFDGADKGFDGVGKGFDGAGKTLDIANKGFDGAGKEFDGAGKAFEDIVESKLAGLKLVASESVVFCVISIGKSFVWVLILTVSTFSFSKTFKASVQMPKTK